MIIAKHVFKGLKRPLSNVNNQDGKEKLIYSWKPTCDYDWKHRGRFDGDDGVVERAPPDGKVFVVIATPNTTADKFPDVDFWIENNWAWVEEAEDRPFAPIGWSDRYDERLGFS